MTSILSAMVCPFGRCRPVQAGADPGEDLQVHLAGMQLVLQEHQEFFHRPGDPVRLVDHQRVARLQRLECRVELRAGAAVLAVSTIASWQSTPTRASSRI
jgi:hypothetical protein